MIGRDITMRRVEIVDPLRGLAALVVMWFHFTNGSGFIKTAWLRASGKYGWLGVEIFFVISGFVIPYSMHCGGYRLRQHFGRFLAKRMVRLEPPYLVSIVLVIALSYLSSRSPWFAGPPPHFSTAQLLFHMGYLNPFFGYPWLNPVYWSLGIEFQFYIFVAIVYPFLVARRAVLRILVLAGMVGAAFLIQMPILVFHYLGLFTLGILAFQHHAELCPRRLLIPMVIIVSAIIAVSVNFPTGLVGGTTALIIVFVPMPQHVAMRVFVFLGRISYSIYLLHVIIGGRVMNLGSRFNGGLLWELGVLAVAIVVTVGAAFGFNLLVERPAQRLSSWIKYSPRQSAAGISPMHEIALSAESSEP